MVDPLAPDRISIPSPKNLLMTKPRIKLPPLPVPSLSPSLPEPANVPSSSMIGLFCEAGLQSAVELNDIGDRR